MRNTVGSALRTSWFIASRTWVVALYAIAAAAVWTGTLAWVGNVDSAADGVVLAAFFALLLSTGCFVASVTALTAAFLEGGTGERGCELIAKRGPSAMLAAMALGLVGIALSALLRSFPAAVFVCAFLFAYALPLSVRGNGSWLLALWESARIAFHRPASTLISAALVSLAGIVGLSIAYAFAGIPVGGVFLESLVIHATIGCCAVFMLVRSLEAVAWAPQAAVGRPAPAGLELPQAS